MENQSLIKEYAKYTSLNILGMLGLSCYILADTFFISKGLGANGLAALNLAIPIYSLIHGSGLMLGMGGAIKYSIFQGKRASEYSDIIFSDTVRLAMMLAVLFVTAGLFFSDALTHLLGADAEVAKMTRIYLKVILLFSPFFMMNDILVCFVRNDGAPRLSMLAMLGGSFSNIVLDYVFIFPLQMGIFGAVLATGIAPVEGMLILSTHLLKKRNGFHLRRVRFHPGMMISSLTLGVPSLVTEVSSGIVIIIFNMIILSLVGNVGVAAYGVVANLSLVVTAVYTGVAQGMQPIISQEYGRGERWSVRKILRYGVVTILVMSFAVYLLMYLFADPITGIFNSEGNARLQEIAREGLRLYFIAAPFVGFNIVTASFFAATEKAALAQVISVLRGFLLIIPMAFVMAKWLDVTGVWMAFPVTEGAVSLIGMVLYRNSCKKMVR